MSHSQQTQEFLVERKTQVDADIAELREFVWSADFDQVSIDRQQAIGDQLQAMEEYSEALAARIALFKPASVQVGCAYVPTDFVTAEVVGHGQVMLITKQRDTYARVRLNRDSAKVLSDFMVNYPASK